MVIQLLIKKNIVENVGVKLFSWVEGEFRADVLPSEVFWHNALLRRQKSHVPLQSGAAGWTGTHSRSSGEYHISIDIFAWCSDITRHCANPNFDDVDQLQLAETEKGKDDILYDSSMIIGCSWKFYYRCLPQAGNSEASIGCSWEYIYVFLMLWRVRACWPSIISGDRSLVVYILTAESLLFHVNGGVMRRLAIELSGSPDSRVKLAILTSIISFSYLKATTLHS